MRDRLVYEVAGVAAAKADIEREQTFQKGLGACHSLAHPLSSEKNLHHGLANAICLPAVVEFNENVIEGKLDRIRDIFDESAPDLATALRTLRTRIGLPSGLRSEGVTEADVAKLAAKAFEDACHRSNPRPTTQDDLARLYEKSL